MILFALTAALMTSPPPKVLVVTATSGFRHESIETAEGVIASVAAASGAFVPQLVRTEEELPAALTAETLAATRVVMMVNTTGDLRWPERQRLLDWVESGGSFVGVHSAADTWHDWPEYLDMLGGEFETHPPESQVDVYVDDPHHPATRHITTPHEVFEEIYLFRRFSRDGVHMLMSLRASPAGGSPGFFPLAWRRHHGRGLVLYTALGHRVNVWEAEWFQQHLRGLIDSALAHPTTRRRAVGR